MNTDLIARLRTNADFAGYGEDDETMRQAASALEAADATEKALRERVRVLEDAIETELGRLYAANNGSTHYAGCESKHPRCAAILRMNAALGERT
jgi:hypothetical protein